MNDSQWDQKLKSFLKKTGQDFKQFGNDLKGEAEQLMREVQDPKRQEKVREGLREVSVWARKTAEDVAVLVEQGAREAGKAINRATEQVSDSINKSVGSTPEQKQAPIVNKPPPPAEPARAAATPESQAPRKPAKKTVGRGAAKKSGTASGKSSKSIGKKKAE